VTDQVSHPQKHEKLYNATETQQEIYYSEKIISTTHFLILYRWKNLAQSQGVLLALPSLQVIPN
jgi:hypothetical protein